MKRLLSTPLVLGICFVILLIGVLMMQSARQHRAEREQAQQRGAALLHGGSQVAGSPSIEAHLRYHTEMLPAAAVRCSNCHIVDAGASESGTKSSANQATNRFGPALNQTLLTTLTRRRGGPPSRYTAASLCTLLRSNLDPAVVLINQAMPQYSISDDQCADMWAYLNTL